MSDSRANNEEFAKLDTVSMLQTNEILRHLGHRIAVDGTTDPGVLEFLHDTAVNTSLLGIIPQVAIGVHSDTTSNILVSNPGDARIVIFDLLLSINGITVISFLDAAGNNVLAPMYAPNAGQGYSHTAIRGLWLPIGASLFMQSSVAVNHSCYLSYKVVSSS